MDFSAGATLRSERSSSKTYVRGSKRRVAQIQQLIGAAFFGGAAWLGRLANSEPVGAAQFSVALASLGGAKSAGNISYSQPWEPCGLNKPH